MKTDKMRSIWGGNLNKREVRRRIKIIKIKNDEKKTGTGTSCNWGSVADC